MSDADLFVEALRAEVSRRNLSEHAAAEIVGVSQSTIHNWLAGNKSPYRSNFGRICNLLPAAKLLEIHNAIGLPEDVSERVRLRLATARMSEEGKQARNDTFLYAAAKAANEASQTSNYGVGLLGGSVPGVIVNTRELGEFLNEAIGDANPITIARLAGIRPRTLDRLQKGELAQWFPGALAGLIKVLKIKVRELPISTDERNLLHDAYEDGAATRPVWVLSLARAASVDSIADVFEEQDGWQMETTMMPVDGRDYLAFDVEGSSVNKRGIFDGSRVICDLNAPLVTNKVVVARFGPEAPDYLAGQVVCKVLYKQGATWHLMSDSTDEFSESYRDVDPKWIAWIVRAVNVVSALD